MYNKKFQIRNIFLSISEHFLKPYLITLNMKCNCKIILKVCEHHENNMSIQHQVLNINRKCKAKLNKGGDILRQFKMLRNSLCYVPIVFFRRSNHNNEHLVNMLNGVKIIIMVVRKCRVELYKGNLKCLRNSLCYVLLKFFILSNYDY